MNATIRKIAKRVRELADQSLDNLRAEFPLETSTREELIRDCRKQGFSRGELIEGILLNQFLEDESD